MNNKKIVRIYENIKGETIQAFFNINGFKQVTYQYDSGYPAIMTEPDFIFKIKNENWKLINEEYIKK